MSERRPHWDDELFDAVIDGFRITPYDDEVYAVIAAVEDWQKKRWASITQYPMEVAVQFNALEAAIQRVQGIIAEGQKDRGWGHDDDFDAGWDRCANDILRALNGGDDD